MTGWKLGKRGGALIVALVTLAVFLPILQGEFLSWDDDGLFVQNPWFRGLGASHWQWMCTTFLYGHWQPLSWLSYALDYTLWGMNPQRWHIANLLLHTLNALLVYRLCLAVCEKKQKNGGAVVSALLAALFWAVHPLRVEVVAWLSTRGYLLCTTFCLLTVWFYFKDKRAYWAALLCFALATLTKGIGMMLPPVLLLVDWYGAGSGEVDEYGSGGVWAWWRHRIVEKIPFFALSLVTGITAFLAKRADGGMVPVEHYGWTERIGQAVYGVWFYLLKTISPQNLSPLYEKRPGHWQILAVLLFFTAAGVLLLLFIRRAASDGPGKAAPAGRLFPVVGAFGAFLLLIFPMLGITQSGSQMYADRFTYLATVPFCFLLAAGLGRVSILRRTVYGTLAALLLGFSAQTLVYSRIWTNGVVLWMHAVALDSSQSGAHNNLGIEWIAAGDYERALDCFNQAVVLRPDYADALNNRALIKMNQGEYQSALADIDVALAQKGMRTSDRSKMRMVRGLALEELNEVTEAVHEYSMVIEQGGGAPIHRLQALQARARLRLAEGKIPESIDDLNAMLALPDPSGTFHSRAKKAIDQLSTAVEPVE